jgi:hypothetical protein
LQDLCRGEALFDGQLHKTVGDDQRRIQRNLGLPNPCTMSRFSFSDNTAPLRGTFDSALLAPSSVDSQARDEKVPEG